MATAKTTVFKNEEELVSTVIRRARAIMGMRGHKNAATIPVNTTVMSGKRHTLELTDDQIAELAREVASDTLYWDYR